MMSTRRSLFVFGAFLAVGVLAPQVVFAQENVSATETDDLVNGKPAVLVRFSEPSTRATGLIDYEIAYVEELATAALPATTKAVKMRITPKGADLGHEVLVDKLDFGTQYTFGVRARATGDPATYVIGASNGSALITSAEPDPLDAPGGFSGKVGKEGGSVDLSWNTVTDATKYMVRWRTVSQDYGISDDQEKEVDPPATGTKVTTTVDGLEAGMEYLFQVMAKNEKGTGEYGDHSREITVKAAADDTDDTGDTAAGSGVVSKVSAAKHASYSMLTVKWNYDKALDDVARDEGFHVYYVKGATVGDKAPSPEQEAAVLRKLDSEADLLDAEKADAEVPQNHTAGVGGGTDFEYVLTGLTPGTLYAVTVHAYSGVRKRDIDVDLAMADAAATAAAPAPTGVRNVTVTPGDKTLTVKWAPPTNTGHQTLTIDTYKVRHNTSQTADDSAGDVIMYPPAGTKLTATEYTITGLLNDVMYDVQVQAVNSGGSAGPWSPADPGVRATPSAAATTPDPAEPATAPPGVEAMAGDAKVTVSWQVVDDATQYMVEWRTASQDYGATARQEVVPTGTTHDVTGLENGMEYMFRVKAGNDVGYGPASGEVKATPAAAPAPDPGAPATAPVVQAVGGDAMVTVSWDAVEGATKYMVEWRTASQTYGAADRRAPATGMTHAITGLENGMEYMIHVMAGNDAGYGPASAEVKATPAMPTPALPVFGALALGAGLVAAGRRRLRARRQLEARQRPLLKA